MRNPATGSYQINPPPEPVDMSRLHIVPPAPKRSGQWVYVPHGHTILITPSPDAGWPPPADKDPEAFYNVSRIPFS